MRQRKDKHGRLDKFTPSNKGGNTVLIIKLSTAQKVEALIIRVRHIPKFSTVFHSLPNKPSHAENWRLRF